MQMTVAPGRPAPFLLALGMAALLPSFAHAAPYPANTCVGVKQERAGRYCKAAFRAWSKWEITQSDALRDAALASAGGKLGTKWGKAETTSLAAGTDCADTTLSVAAAQALIDAAVADVVTTVNGGLDLGTRSDAKCGSKLLRAAARKCAALLAAEGDYIADLALDPDGVMRGAAELKASSKFGLAWSKAIIAGCPTSAEAGAVESQIDAISADVVRQTTVSPNVDDAQFTTFSPTGTTSYLDRELTPICMNGTPYHYFAKRGTVNKLLVYYQGGGACWEQLTCSVPACDTNVNPAGSDNPNNVHSGFADYANPANPFKDWNIVFVSYCSCDVHFGDAAQDYPLHVEHRGYQNSRVVEKWAREHFLNPERVFVTGSSAGAYGAWFNAPLHERVWPASHFDVLADAGNGVITQDFLENFFPNWNFADNIPSDIPGLADLLTNGEGIPGYTELVANFFPDTRWAHYSSAYDGSTGGQSAFYNIMLNGNQPIYALGWHNASCAYNTQMRIQALATAAAVPSNYRYYIGTGSRHTMFGSNKVYTDTTGGVPTLVDWVNAMLDGSPGWSNVECTNCGLTLPGDPVPSPLAAPFEMQGSDIVVDCGSPGGAFLD